MYIWQIYSVVSIFTTCAYIHALYKITRFIYEHGAVWGDTCFKLNFGVVYVTMYIYLSLCLYIHVLYHLCIYI